MEQYDLFTKKVSATSVSESFIIPTVNSPSDLERFLDKLNVVKVGVYFLGSAVQKRPISENYRGVCPFHNERMPSFYLKPKPNYFVCYGCHEVGGPLTLWARLDGRALDDLMASCGLQAEEVKGIFEGKDVSLFAPPLSPERQQYYTLFHDAVQREYVAAERFGR